MNTTRTLLLFITALLFLSRVFGESHEQSDIAHDFLTPEGAVLCLENAYRTNDIEKAVRCKDFRGEAEEILRDRPAKVRSDAGVIAETTRTLELGYRTEIRATGFPNMKGVTSTFTQKRQLSPDRVVLTEVFHLPDGSKHTEAVHVRRTNNGWRVISARHE